MDQAQRNGLALLLKNIDPALTDMSGFDELMAKGARERAALNAINDAARAERDGSNKPVNELARLRGELWQLEHAAKNTEVYTNNLAGTVKLLESNLAQALLTKKQYGATGNLIAERNGEHTVARLEREVLEATTNFRNARRVSAGAAIALSQWPHRERVKELEKLVA